MKRIAIGLVIGMLGGAVAGFGLGIFIYPFWFLNDVAQETLAQDIERTQIAAGEFIHANPSDPVHWGKGRVELFKEKSGQTVVFLTDDFEVGPGPRFHVYLVDHSRVTSRSAFLDSEKVDLGRLRAFRGSQVYSVPAEADATKFKSVVIWCKEFGVLISPATLVKDANAPKQERDNGKV